MVVRRRHESSGASQGERPHCGTAAGRGRPLSRPRPPLPPSQALLPPARWHCAERRVVAVHVALRHLAPGSEGEAQETAAHPAALAVSSAQQLRGGGARGRRRHLPSAHPLSFPFPFSQQALRKAQAPFTLLARKVHPAAPCCPGATGARWSMGVNPRHWRQGGRLYALRHVKGRRPHPPRATRTAGPAAPLTEHTQTPLSACSLPPAAAASQDPRAVATAGPCGSQPAVSRHPRHSMVASSRRSPRSQGREDVDLRDEGRSRPRGAPTRGHGATPLRARQGTCVRRAAPPRSSCALRAVPGGRETPQR